MRYKVTLASFPICSIHPATLGPIPGTERSGVWDTEEGPGKLVWDGYLEMAQKQKETGKKVGYEFAGIELDEKAPMIDRFREALNAFLRFLAGEGRDNGQRVLKIECAECDFVKEFGGNREPDTCGACGEVRTGT